LLVLLSGLTACSPQPSSPEEAIAELKQAMAKKPSASTAEEMLDLAMESADAELIFSVLQDIHTWAHVQGVAELFIRGSKDYIARESLGEAVFWLEEEVLKLDPQADLNEAMAGAYVNTPHWEAAKYAERVFARWELTEQAREKFMTVLLASAAWKASLPVEGRTPPVLPVFPERLARREEYSATALYVELWKACWEQKLDGDKLAALESLDAENDPLGLYWQLWAAFLVQGLEPGWQNPLGLDVAARAPQVLAKLNSEMKDEVLGLLYDKRDSNSAPHSRVILEVLAQVGKRQWEDRLADLVSALGARPDVDLVYLVAPALDISQADLNLLERLDSIYHVFGDFLAVKDIVIPKSKLKLKESLHFDTFWGMDISPLAPAALIDGEDGQCLLNFATGKLTKYPGGWGSWSPRGDRFALLKAGNPASELIIYSPEGAELEKHVLPVALEGKHGDEVVFAPRATWESPTELAISLCVLRGTMYGIWSSPFYYSYDLSTKTLTETPWRSSATHVPGTDLFYIHRSDISDDLDEPREEEHLVDQAGNSAGEVLTVQYGGGSSKVSLPGGGELSIEDYAMFYTDSQGKKTKLLDQWEAHTIGWAAMCNDKVYAEVSLSTPQTKGGGFEARIVLDPAGAKADVLRDPQTWYEDVTIACNSQRGRVEIPALFFAENWFYPGRSGTISVGGAPLPAAVTNVFRAYKYGESYILVVGDASESVDVEGQGMVLIFR
jgi:hypothetical protein